MKHFLRKATLFGSTALLALGLCSPATKAAAPTGESMGVLYTETVGIGPAIYDYIPTLTLASGLTYDGLAKQLITAVTNTAQIPVGATLYLRVADTEGAAPSSASDWVQYSDADSLTNTVLKRTNSGTYRIYWYLDGGANGTDIAGAGEGADSGDGPEIP